MSDPSTQLRPTQNIGARPIPEIGLRALLRRWLNGSRVLPIHLDRGQRGEHAAREALIKLGMRFLVANFRHQRGEIDLIFEDLDCLVFVEVKTRSAGGWLRPAAAVNRRKKKLLSKTALAYLKRLKRPKVKFRFDVVEVVLEGERVTEIRHLRDAFPLDRGHRYG